MAEIPRRITEMFSYIISAVLKKTIPKSILVVTDTSEIATLKIGEFLLKKSLCI